MASACPPKAMLPSAAHSRSRVLMSGWAIQGDCRAWQASVTAEQREPSPERKSFASWTVGTHARAHPFSSPVEGTEEHVEQWPLLPWVYSHFRSRLYMYVRGFLLDSPSWVTVGLMSCPRAILGCDNRSLSSFGWANVLLVSPSLSSLLYCSQVLLSSFGFCEYFFFSC